MNAGSKEASPRPPGTWTRLREGFALRTPAGLLRDRLFLLALAVALPVAWGLARFLEPPAFPPGGLLSWLFLRLVCLDPLVEELLFRGLVQGALLRVRAGTTARAGFTVANAGAALLFAAAHLVYHPPIWSALVVVPALVFGFFRDRHGSVVSPILLHVLYNACWLVAYAGTGAR